MAARKLVGGSKPWDNSIFTKQAMWRLGLRFGQIEPAPEDFDEGHVIEIFNPEGIQMFRNFEYLRTCPHTLEDLFFKSYSDLYESSFEHLRDFFYHFVKALNGETIHLRPKDRKTYAVRARGTSFSTWISYLSFVPLLDIKSGYVKAVMVISRRELFPSQRDIELPPGPPQSSPPSRKKREPHWLVQAITYDQVIKPVLEDLIDWVRGLTGFRSSEALAVRERAKQILDLIEAYLHSQRPFATP